MFGTPLTRFFGTTENTVLQLLQGPKNTVLQFLQGPRNTVLQLHWEKTINKYFGPIYFLIDIPVVEEKNPSPGVLAVFHPDVGF